MPYDRRIGYSSVKFNADELHYRGLRTRTTAKHPAKKVSISKLSQMLRDRYYLGYVPHKGE